ncbi:MAG: polyribonucleotide nucleotidyltransferase [Gammaproteobacteria bacterium]|nr:polyribonucleotide nucleotidyltransferase [Gammaproteobacteria bacterium]
MTKVIKEIRLGEHKLVLETGEIARQADGAVFINMGGTQLLVTVVGKKDNTKVNDFFPLTVHYQEKTYAAGKIPGGFNRREGRPSELETLTSRLIDRPIRPLFPKGYRQEVQVVATLLSLNPDVQPDIVAMIGASAALAISGLPFAGPIAASRVGYQDGIYTLNPSLKTNETSMLDLIVAGTKDAILMVESGAQELSEEVMLGAVMFGHEMMKPVIDAIVAFANEVGKGAVGWSAPEAPAGMVDQLNQLAEDGIKDAYNVKDKLARRERLQALRQNVIESLGQQNPEFTPELVDAAFESLEKRVVRQRILLGEPRIDGRDRETVRPIAIRTKCLDRAHGSVLFTRGETQAIVAATLGNDRDAQILDSLVGETRDRFMLHYNFPPYSVGETGMMGSPKRREIGHGRLARRSMMAVLPKTAVFPYVIRVVSEITESNGSSSMATVCGTSLALMDAGVPLKAPVAGIAMGLIKEGEQFAVLTDILGDEDHLGDMDFKVAGTGEGITALQMDIKITGITQQIMEQALEQAKKARLHILGIMNQVLAASRTELSEFAPRIELMKVPEDKIRTIIGKGGVTIKGLIESTGVQIDIDDAGVVQLFSPNAEALREAERQIKQLIAEVEVGQTYHGSVTKIVEFGAFINLLPGKDGLLHISQICNDRTQKVETVLSEGQPISVFVAGVDKQGRVKLEWPDKPAAPVKAAAPVVEKVEESVVAQEGEEE